MPKPRKKVIKAVKPVLHIFCEGDKTEPVYIRGYLRKVHQFNKRSKVVEIADTKKNTPVQLVDEAVKCKKSSNTPPGDEYWVVYDRESVAKYSDSLHAKAHRKAVANNVNVALSNVCFEAWILLHLVESSASYASYDDLIKNSPLREELRKKGIKKYDKAEPIVFEKISDNIDTARERAKKINRATMGASHEDEKKPYRLNPYTNLYKLLDAIDEFLT